MLKAGRYAVIRAEEKAGFQIKRIRNGPLRGRTMLMLRMDDGKWKAVAFLAAGDAIHFYKKFAAETNPEHLAKIREAVAEITSNPEAARDCYQNSYLDEREVSSPQMLLALM